MNLPINNPAVSAAVSKWDAVVSINWAAISVVTHEDFLRLNRASARMPSAGVNRRISHPQASSLSSRRECEPARSKGDDDGQYFSHGLYFRFSFPVPNNATPLRRFSFKETSPHQSEILHRPRSKKAHPL